MNNPELNRFLHLQGITPPDDIRCKWSRACLAWLASLSWPHPTDAFTLASLLRSYQRDREELVMITKQLRQLSRLPRYAADFKRLCAVRWWKASGR